MAVAWEGWRPIGFVLGWKWVLSGGHPVALAETVRIFRKYRGTRARCRALYAAFRKVCLRHGLTRVVTRIEKKRPAVAKVGVRWIGYKKWGDEGDFEWYYLDLI